MDGPERQGCSAVHEFRGGKSGKRHGLARPHPNDLVVELKPHDLVVECSVERKLAAFATVLRVRRACALLRHTSRLSACPPARPHVFGVEALTGAAGHWH